MIFKKYILFFIILFTLGTGSGIFISLKKKEGDKPKVLFKQGKVLLSEGKYEDAILIFKLISSTYSQSTISPYSLYEVGKIQEYYLKNEKMAINTYKKILKYNSALNKRCLKKISIYKSPGHLTYKNIVKNFPQFVEIKYSSEERKYLPSDIDLIIYDFPNLRRFYLTFTKGKIHKENKNYLTAASTFQQLTEETKDKENILKCYLEMSDCYYQSKNYDLSLKYLVENDFSSSRYKYIAELGKGDIMFSLEKYKDALNIYTNIPESFFTSFSPDEYFIPEEIEVKIAKSYEGMKDFKRAIFVYQDLLNKYESSKKIDKNYYLRRTNRVKYYLGNLYQKIGKMNMAISFYQKVNLLPRAFDKEEIQPQALLALGDIYLTQGKIRETNLILNSISELYPQTTYLPEVQLQLSICQEKIGKDVKLEEYENILNLAKRPDTLVKAYYKLVNRSQEELYRAGLPFYTLWEEEYFFARKYGKKVVSSIIEKREEEGRQNIHNLIMSDIYSFLLDFDKVRFEKQYISSPISSQDMIKTKIYKGENIAENLEYLRGRETLYQEIKNIMRKKNKYASDLMDLANLYQNLGLFSERDRIYQEAKSKDKKYTENFYRVNRSEVLQEINKINENIAEVSKNTLEGQHPSPEILNLYEEEFKNILVNLIVGLGDYINPQIYKVDRKINWGKRPLNLQMLIPPDASYKKEHLYLTEKSGEIYLKFIDFKSELDRASATRLLVEINNFKVKQFYK